ARASRERFVRMRPPEEWSGRLIVPAGAAAGKRPLIPCKTLRSLGTRRGERGGGGAGFRSPTPPGLVRIPGARPGRGAAGGNGPLRRKGCPGVKTRPLLPARATALLVVAVGAADDAKPPDPGKLVGDWTYVSGVRGGEKVDKERLAGKVTVTKDTFTLPAGPQDKFVIAYKVDAKAKPAT